MKRTLWLFEKIPLSIRWIIETVEKAGYEISMVGGAVRDMLLAGGYEKSKKDFDFDFATSATPQEIMRLFSHTRHPENKEHFIVPTGIKHGTVTLIIREPVESFEITTYRIDEEYKDGRRPESVIFVRSLHEDLARRDFTINAMAYHPLKGELIDPFGGEEDIRRRLIRCVGDPLVRFLEDGLRPMRACRLSAKLQFEIEEATFSAIPKSMESIKKVAMERFHDEFMKLLKTEKPSIGIEAMRKSGLLEYLMPELLEGIGVDQNEFHRYDVYYHNLYACDFVPPHKPLVRFAALLHDIAKPRAKKFAEQGGHGNVFYNHEVMGERIARRILKRLKASNQEIEWVCKLVRLHMFYYTHEWTDGAVRRFLRRFDGDTAFLEDLFILREADRLASGTKQRTADILEDFKKHIQRVLEQDSALKVTDLDINGYDIMQNFDLKPSPLIGQILNYLLEVVLEHPDYNQKNKLLELTKDYLEGKLLQFALSEESSAHQEEEE